MSQKTFMPPELGPINIAPRAAQSHACRRSLAEPGHWYEAPREDPTRPEVYTYTDAISYDPGDEVPSTPATTARLGRCRSTATASSPRPCTGSRHHRAASRRRRRMPTALAAAGRSATAGGCRHDLRSGFYRVVSTCARDERQQFVQHHFFVVRPTERTRRAHDLICCRPAPGRPTTILAAPTTISASSGRVATSLRLS